VVFLRMQQPEFHIISTGKQSLEHIAAIAAEIYPLVSAFHLREKSRTAQELSCGIRLLLEGGVPLAKIVLNDRADVAQAWGVGGVHLAYHSLGVELVKKAFPELRAGRSVHSLQEALAIEKQGADYLIYGHVFTTGSKPGLPAKGLAGLADTVRQVRLPVIAIGGIKPEHAGPVIRSGAAGIAVMSGVLEAADPVRAARAYYDALQMERFTYGQNS
jgi:thiazole tautomerase (transcriptional regulator TenI)